MNTAVLITQAAVSGLEDELENISKNEELAAAALESTRQSVEAALDAIMDKFRQSLADHESFVDHAQVDFSIKPAGKAPNQDSYGYLNSALSVVASKVVEWKFQDLTLYSPVSTKPEGFDGVIWQYVYGKQSVVSGVSINPGHRANPAPCAIYILREIDNMTFTWWVRNHDVPQDPYTLVTAKQAYAVVNFYVEDYGYDTGSKVASLVATLASPGIWDVKLEISGDGSTTVVPFIIGCYSI